MARPIPHPGTKADLNVLYDWAVKLTQGLKERFAPQDTLIEAEPVIPEPFPMGASAAWPTAIPFPDGFVEQGTVQLRADYPELFALWGTTFNTGGESGLEFRMATIPVGTGFTILWKATPA